MRGCRDSPGDTGGGTSIIRGDGGGGSRRI